MTDLDAVRDQLAAAGRVWRNTSRSHSAQCEVAHARYVALRDRLARQRAELIGELTALARDAIAAGLSERETADLLGVSRTRTLRRWLGK